MREQANGKQSHLNFKQLHRESKRLDRDASRRPLFKRHLFPAQVYCRLKFLIRMLTSHCLVARRLPLLMVHGKKPFKPTHDHISRNLLTGTPFAEGILLYEVGTEHRRKMRNNGFSMQTLR